MVVACPTTPLTRQWARAADGLGVDLAPDADSPRPPSGLSRRLGDLRPDRQGAGALGTDAAAPHAGDRRRGPSPRRGADLGRGLRQGVRSEPRWLLLSGTPFRSDATPIPGVSYDADGLAEPDVSYSYAEAVADGICRPVCFVAYDGTLSWRSGDDVIESTLRDRALQAGGQPPLPDGDLDRAARRALQRILGEADAKLRGDPSGRAIATPAAWWSPPTPSTPAGSPRCCARSPAACRWSCCTPRHAPPPSSPRSPNSTDPWIVAVNMVSEGVDIPRLRVGVYATAAKTPLIFRQIVGRFVRTLPGGPAQPSWLYVPADPVLRDHAATIEQELRRALRRPDEDRDRFEHRASRGPPRDRARRAHRVRAAERRRRAADDVVRIARAPARARAGGAVAGGGRWAAAMADAQPVAGGNGATHEPREIPAFERRATLSRRAPPARLRGPAARRHQPPRDQRLAEPQARASPASSRPRSPTWSARSSCSWGSSRGGADPPATALGRATVVQQPQDAGN